MNCLTLVPFSKDQAELTLSWRNQQRVRENSINDQQIALEAHLAFIEQLQQDSSREYFVIKLGCKGTGVISFTGVGSADVSWGCYFAQDTLIPGLFAALLFIAADHAFTHIDAERLCSEVLAHNKQPQQMNAWLGIPVTGQHEIVRSGGVQVSVLEYTLGREQWREMREGMLKKLPSSARHLAQTYTIENRT
ncbi:GNAT family N-acetyltransferase [Nitrincola alkalilacustris]|uniref:GNAT family N-acetyltransferase n=1 Tax=Nitrincola alkalilacustris TaxID=1571224 RepID=UPI00124D0BB0|nr:GNAT family N-acetyltransferase [Nitrincola alkalilacustris]